MGADNPDQPLPLPAVRPAGAISLYEEELYGAPQTGETVRQLVLFRLGGEWFGVHIVHVHGVVPVRFLSPLPFCPGHIMGVFNLRGNIVSVTDLKPFFGLSERKREDQGQAVVIEHPGSRLTTALWVDGAVEIVEVPLAKIEPPVPTLEGEKRELIEGQVEWQGRLIAVLNVPKVLERTRVTS